jgi:cytochrome P450
MDALRIVVSRAQQPPIPLVASLSSGDRRLAEALSVINSSVAELVARRESAGASEDTLSLLIDARDQGVITEQQVRDEVVTLIVAGHETVAATLTWTWLLLAANPHVERLVHSEASALNADDASSPLVLERLPITCAVVQECLRLYPPAWVITRRALREQSVGGFDMPSGTTVIMSPYLLHRDDRRWPEPERFDPMRFQSGTVQSPAAARSFLPFGTGPRLCIGRDLALVEAPLVIAAISRLLRLRALRPAAVVEDFGVTLRPRGGLLMQVLGREQISAE